MTPDKVDHELLQRRIKENMGSIKRIVAVMSGKGGVGKTTVAVNLASGLAARGVRTGILDADIHGPNVPLMLGLEGERPMVDEKGFIPLEGRDDLKVFSMSFLLQSRNDPVIWRGPMKAMAITQFLGEVQWGDLDYLIVDLPPGTGDEILTIAQNIPRSDAIVVTTPQDVSLLDSRKAVVFARRLDMRVLGIVENMGGFKCPHCGEDIDLFKVGGGERAAREMGVPFLGRIPFDLRIMEGGDSGDPPVLLKDNPIMSIVDRVQKGGGE